MSDIHILKQATDQKTVQCLFHIPIPAGDNSAGVPWRNAVVLEQGGSGAIVSALPGITAGEDTKLKSGELLERSETVRFSTAGQNLTPAQRLAEVQAAFAGVQNSLVAKKQVTLEFYGWEGDSA